MLKRGGQAAFRDDRVFAEPCWGRTLEGLKKTFSSSTRPSTCIASSCPRGQGSIVAPLSLERMAPQVGLEPTTLRLTAGCSAIELLRSVCALPTARQVVAVL